MANLFQRLVIVFFSLLLLSGCVASGGGWPVSTYDHACHTGMIPSEPFCLFSADYDDGFKYSDQFQACRQSVSNFAIALDEYYRCSDTKLKAILDQLLVSVPATYNCYVEFFKDKKEGDPSAACPPVDIPLFFHSYEADGLEADLGVPRCIAKTKVYNFAPKRVYQLDDCRDQVELFTGKAIRSYSLNAASAQGQYDTFLRNLRWVLDRKSDDAISKFNCIAEGRSYCL